MLERYQAFTDQKYDTDNSYLVSMQNIVKSVKDLSPQNNTVGNIHFQVTKSGDKTLIQWLYVENGVCSNWKKLELSFIKNAFNSFRDTWSLYKISGPNMISSDEVTKIALDAAQKYEFHVGYKDGTKIIKTPDLSNASYTMNYALVPFRNDTYLFGDSKYPNPLYLPSKLARDPLTLYPYWQFIFYLNETIGGCNGIQVGVYGDTKEIAYCSGYGSLGLNEYDGDFNEQNVDTQKQADESTIVAIIGFIALAGISTSIVAVIHRKHNR